MLPFQGKGKRTADRQQTISILVLATLLVSLGSLVLDNPGEDRGEEGGEADGPGPGSGESGGADGPVTAAPGGSPDLPPMTRQRSTSSRAEHPETRQRSPSPRAEPPETMMYDLRHKDPSPVVYNEGEGDWTGWKMAVGDLNDDGIDDWVISSPFKVNNHTNAEGAGRVHIIFGADRQDLRSGDIHLDSLEENVTIYGLDEGDNFGYDLAVGDYDGDGIDDLAVGAPWADGGGNGAEDIGEVHLFWGREDWPEQLFIDVDPLVSDSNLIIYGQHEGCLLGYSLDAGNFDGDAYGDILMGAPRTDGSDIRLASGKAHLITGRPRATFPNIWALVGNPAFCTVVGKEQNDYMGQGVMLADWDGDGKDEIVTGAIWGDGESNTRTNSGEMAVVKIPDTFVPPLEFDFAATEPQTWIYAPDGGDTAGRRMSKGDLNGDGVEDLLLAVPWGDGQDNDREDTGEVHVLFGSADVFGAYGSGTEILDLRTDAHITWYGIGSYDYAGYSMACLDMEGDGKEEVLIGANLGNGPLNKRINAGEVYIAGGQYAEVGDGWGITGGTLANYTVIYGPDEGDALGSSVATGDIDGDGWDDILMGGRGGGGMANDKDDAGECWVLFDLPDPLEITDLRLEDGATPAVGDPAQEGKVCHSGLKHYTFTAEAVDPYGSGDVRAVNVTLDPGVDRLSLQFSWDRDDGFAEVHDPDDLIDVGAGASGVETLSQGRIKVHFKVGFSWDFPTENLLDARVTVYGSEAFSINHTFHDAFRVENDLNLTGELEVTSGGEPLGPDHWVAGGSTLQWSGLKAHYENNVEISPPDGDFDLYIEDDDGDSWVQEESTMLGLDMQTTCDAESDPFDNHSVSIVNVPLMGEPGGPVVPEPLNFTVRVDAEPPDPVPGIVFVADPSGGLPEGDLYDDDRVFTVRWDEPPDNGSGVAGYWYSLEYNGGTANGIETNVTNGGFSNAPEGPNTVYVWSYDRVGNMEGSAHGTILIDLKPAEASQPVVLTPAGGNGTFNTSTVEVAVTFTDPSSFGAGSGIDPALTEYAVTGPDGQNGTPGSDEGLRCVEVMERYGPPDTFEEATFDVDTGEGTLTYEKAMEILSMRDLTVGRKEALTGINTTSLTFNVTLDLPEGGSSILFRGGDLAGGTLVESPSVGIVVNTTVWMPNLPPVPVITSPTADGAYLTSLPVSLSSHGTYDMDGDLLDYWWTSSRDGLLLLLPEGQVNLSAGNHTITLTVDDGHDHVVEAHVDIMVESDWDGDLLPDDEDPDDDNDGVPDIDDAGPFDPNVGADEDVGVDGAVDEGGGNGLMILAIVIAVVVVVVLATSIFIIRSKRIRARSEEEGAQGEAVDAEVELKPGWGISDKSDLDLIRGDGVDTTGVSAQAGGPAGDAALPPGGHGGAPSPGASGEVHVETRADTTLTAGPGGTPGGGAAGAGPGGASGPGAGLGTGAAAGTGGVPKLPPAPQLHPERPVSSEGPAYEKPPEGSPYSGG